MSRPAPGGGPAVAPGGYNAGMTTAVTPAAINLRRLAALRVIAITGQLLAVWTAAVPLRMPLPLQPLVTILVGMALANVLTGLRLRRTWPVRDAELFAHLLLDVLAFTGLLYYTGGSTNPFAPLYLLPITLAAAALPARHVWGLVGVTVACYTALLFFYVPLPGVHTMHDDAFQLHVAGMWSGFLLSAGLIAWFAARMNATLRDRDRLAAEMREQALRHERVLALGTLAAGAAHELGTPLSTLAVLLKDARPDEPPGERKLGTLRGQVARCKEILSSLTAQAGVARAEGGNAVALDAWLREIVEKWRAMRPEATVREDVSGDAPAPRVFADQTLSQAITSILNNAADASPRQIDLSARWSGDELAIEIADRGSGLAPGLSGQLGASPVTTKDEGLGLGLFLAQTTMQRFGGDLTFRPRDGGGTVCRLTLPLAALRVPAL